MPRTEGTYLEDILADVAAGLAARDDLPTAPPAARGVRRDFRAALAAPGISLIAEAKQASPSLGLIRPGYDPAALARSYVAGGARAMSVITEERHFCGCLGDLDLVRAACDLPLLRKDFIIHRAQIYEAVGRADAVLLIVAALSVDELRDLLDCASDCGLDALVEVHDRAELEIACAAGADIIGINNRDLRTFRVDVGTTHALLPFVPAGSIVVSESGIRSGEDVRALAAAGVDAILVGEALLRAGDPADAARGLLAGAAVGAGRDSA